MSSNPHSLPGLLRLPRELRDIIYSYLIPRENVSHPLPSVGITSVSHRPPSISLLNLSPQITDEVLDYYYNIATWKLIFSHAFNFFRVDPDLKKLEQSPSLKRLRKVEVVFYCDILLLRDYPSFGLQGFCNEIRRRADRACSVLLHANQLETVTVSWIDTTATGGWEEKARILQPLSKLREAVKFRIGEINGPEDFDRESFIAAMQNALGHPHQLELATDGAHEEPSSLRLLAFDVRQDRHLCYTTDESVASSGYQGWQQPSFLGVTVPS